MGLVQRDSIQRDGPALSPRRIRADLGLSREKMGRLMSVSAKTIENWERDDRVPPDESKRSLLATIAQVRELGLSVYTPEGLARFLTTPLTVFGNHTALQEIELGHADRVIGELAADYEGLGY